MIKVTAAIIIKDHKVLIAKRKPAVRLANLWEFPGGKLEVGETPGRERRDAEALIGVLKHRLEDLD